MIAVIAGVIALYGAYRVSRHATEASNARRNAERLRALGHAEFATAYEQWTRNARSVEVLAIAGVILALVASIVGAVW